MFNNLPNVYTFDPMIKTFWGGLCAILISILLATSLVGQSPPSASLLTQAVQRKEFEKASRIAYELGSVAWSNSKQEEAKKYLIQSLTYAKRAGTSVQSFYAASFLAKIYYETDDFNNSADFYERSAGIAEELGYHDAAIENYVRQGESLARLKRYKKAVAPTENALKIAVALRTTPLQIRCYELLRDYYKESGNIRKADEAGNLLNNLITLQQNEVRAREHAALLEAQAEVAIQRKEESEDILELQTARLKDTQESLKAVEELNAKRQLEINLLSKEKELSGLRIEEQNARLENEALVRNSILIVILLSSSLAGVMIINYRKQIRTNRKIDLQNKNIKSSINYAKRIQEAMLPSRDFQQSLFHDSFILFKPRDLVSGDFYWFSAVAKESQDLAFAAIDCTGHGVPGAFMSMIGFNSLNNIINQGITSADEILAHLHRRIRNALQQDLTGNNDGMDLSLCIYRKNSFSLEFSGAKSPLVYIQDNALFQIKGDVHSIGGSRSRPDQVFRKHTVTIDKPTMVYLFTDGFRDQFGGADNQKFMSKRFSKLLLEIHQLPLTEQLDILAKTFDTWKGSREQTDDVLVIGVRLRPEL